MGSESSAPRRPTHTTQTSRREVKITYTHTHTQNTNIQIHHENHWIDCIYHAASYGFSTFWSVSCPNSPEWRCRLQGAGRTRDVPTPHGRKLALIPLADLADIGLGVQKIFNPTN